MTRITTYLSILTLNVNVFNSSIKRHHLSRWIKKEEPTIYCLQETHFIDRNKDSLEEDLPKLWPLKTCKSSNVYLGRSKLQTYIDETR
jgi:exonuclease III